jgi:cyanophycinase-like exopeptidase
MPLHLTLAFPAQHVVLIGGGEFSFGETREIDEYLLANLPEGKRRVVFLPTASGSSEYATHFGAYLRGIAPDIEVVNVPVYRGRDSRRQKNADTILSAGMVYLGGGVTNNLLDCLRGSTVDLAMRDAAVNGTTIAAIGAAASSFGTHARNMRTPAAALEGLGWFTDTVIETSFSPGDDTMLRRLMSTPGTDTGVGIPPATAVAVRADGSTEVIGEGEIAVFRKG